MDHPFDTYGLDRPADLSISEKVAREALPAVVGGLAAFIARGSHPFLAFLGVSALAGNVQAVLRGERTPKEAALRMGRHAIATATALATPSHAWLGYVGGAFAADLLFDGKGDGIVDEWARYAGINVDKKVATEAGKESTAITVVEKKR